MIKSKTEFLTGLKTLIGDDTSDNTLELLEYASHIDETNETEIATLNERITTLENEKNNLDKTWREKYRDAFFNPDKLDLTGGKEEDNTPENYPITFDDLFTPI